MKRLFYDNSIGILAVPILTFPMAWFCNKWLQGIKLNYIFFRIR